MRKIFLLILAIVAFSGCSSKSSENKNVEPKLVVGKSLLDLELHNQYGKVQKIAKDTKIIFFSFSKPTGHACNALLEKEPANFLLQHKALYVADVSPAPSLIKKLFILPDLKELKFPILLINDDKLSAEYSKGLDKKKIIVVFLKNGVITKIQKVKDTEALKAIFASDKKSKV